MAVCRQTQVPERTAVYDKANLTRHSQAMLKHEVAGLRELPAWHMAHPCSPQSFKMLQRFRSQQPVGLLVNSGCSGCQVRSIEQHRASCNQRLIGTEARL